MANKFKTSGSVRLVQLRPSVDTLVSNTSADLSKLYWSTADGDVYISKCVQITWWTVLTRAQNTGRQITLVINCYTISEWDDPTRHHVQLYNCALKLPTLDKIKKSSESSEAQVPDDLTCTAAPCSDHCSVSEQPSGKYCNKVSETGVCEMYLVWKSKTVRHWSLCFVRAVWSCHQLEQRQLKPLSDNRADAASNRLKTKNWITK